MITGESPPVNEAERLERCHELATETSRIVDAVPPRAARGAARLRRRRHEPAGPARARYSNRKARIRCCAGASASSPGDRKAGYSRPKFASLLPWAKVAPRNPHESAGCNRIGSQLRGTWTRPPRAYQGPVTQSTRPTPAAREETLECVSLRLEMSGDIGALQRFLTLVEVSITN